MRNPVGTAISWIHIHRPANPGRFVMPYLVVVMTVLLFVNLIQVGNTRDFANELRDGLVASCEKNGNPLREGLQEEKEADIEEAEHPPPAILEVLHITAERAIALARPKIRKLRRDVRTRYAPVDCASLYP